MRKYSSLELFAEHFNASSLPELFESLKKLPVMIDRFEDTPSANTAYRLNNEVVYVEQLIWREYSFFYPNITNKDQKFLANVRRVIQRYCLALEKSVNEFKNKRTYVSTARRIRNEIIMIASRVDPSELEQE